MQAWKVHKKADRPDGIAATSNNTPQVAAASSTASPNATAATTVAADAIPPAIDDHSATINESTSNVGEEDSDTAIDPCIHCNLEGSAEAGETLPDNACNLAIAYLFIHVFKAPELKEWKGRGATQSQIRQRLDIPSNTSIIPVPDHVWACHQAGIVYDGRTEREKSGPQPKVSLDSVEAEIVASAIEDGMSIRNTLNYINTWLHTNKQSLWTYWNVQSLVKRLQPTVTAVGTQKQGSSNPNSAWAWARYNWVSHLMVRFGVANGLDLEKERIDSSGSVVKYIPDYWDQEKVTTHVLQESW